VDRPTTSQRDPQDLRQRLQAWLSIRAEAPVAIDELQIPEANGMSSETVLFNAIWPPDGQVRPLAAKIAPDPTALRFSAPMTWTAVPGDAHVRRHSGVPVPAVLWSEVDTATLGVPFL